MPAPGRFAPVRRRLTRPCPCRPLLRIRRPLPHCTILTSPGPARMLPLHACVPPFRAFAPTPSSPVLPPPLHGPALCLRFTPLRLACLRELRCAPQLPSPPSRAHHRPHALQDALTRTLEPRPLSLAPHSRLCSRTRATRMLLNHAPALSCPTAASHARRRFAVLYSRRLRSHVPTATLTRLPVAIPRLHAVVLCPHARAAISHRCFTPVRRQLALMCPPCLPATPACPRRPRVSMRCPSAAIPHTSVAVPCPPAAVYGDPWFLIHRILLASSVKGMGGQ
ncbi:hypothetical protein DENSPDRAFT_886244 [Dentipellis sp. KUC8613]|nr:hypothetical protein DENSPDRAFT_886244 [Dentipellis sp. KUC8613]